jgi:hypothetical protein
MLLISLHHLLDSTFLFTIFIMHLIVQQGLWSFKLELTYLSVLIMDGVILDFTYCCY